MKLFRKSLLSFVVALCCVVACQQEEAVAPNTDEAFVTGTIATVTLPGDVEVGFVEVKPGSVITSVMRSADAGDKLPSDLVKLLRGSDYAATYQKLAGASADPASVKKLQAATARVQARILTTPKRKKVAPGSVAADLDIARVKACSGGNNGADWFYNNIWFNDNEELVRVSLQRNISYHHEYASTDDTGEWYICAMNGQRKGSGNNIRFQWDNDWSEQLLPWTYKFYIMGVNDGAWITVSYVDASLDCRSTHVSYHWDNLFW